MTARRDLALLNESGYLLRTHGGAMLPEGAVHAQTFRTRLEQHVPAKLRLADAVTGALEPRETVFLDSSSSSYYVARQIIESGLPITLITNSLPVISLVGDVAPKHIELIGVSGEFRKRTQSFVDPLTMRAIERLSADRAIFSVNGIAPDGPSLTPIRTRRPSSEP